MKPASLMKDAAWDFACPDWADRLAAGKCLAPDLPLNDAEADRAVGIFNKLRLPDVVGTPTLGEAAGDWIRDSVVRPLFGSIDEDGVRRVSEVFVLVPKKNSKTTNAAAIMVTALIMNNRPNAEYLLFGPTQEIAALSLQQAAGMIKADTEDYLINRFQLKEHVKTIVDRTNGSTLKIMTFDMKVATGSKPAGVGIDELHLLSAYSYASRVIGQIRGGMAARPDSFLLFITTQSDETPSGCFKAELAVARGIRDGRIKGPAARILPVLYEFPESMQTGKDRAWQNPANWHMVLPNLGLSISIDWLIASFAQAKEKGEEEIRRWASQHLNIEIGLGLHSARWRGADYWEAAGDPDVTLDAIIARCDVAVVGVDGGGLDDLFGLCVAGRDAETSQWLYWGHAWCQRDVLDLRKDIAEKLIDFEKAGDLTLCDDGTQDIREVADICQRLKDEGLLPEEHAIGLDPMGVAALVDELDSRGIGDKQVTGISQGFRLSGAVWGMERKLKDGTLRHGGQPMMAWCVGNAKAEQRGNAVLITKETAGKAKIDPLVAAFNATKLLERNPLAARTTQKRKTPSIMVL